MSFESPIASFWPRPKGERALKMELDTITQTWVTSPVTVYVEPKPFAEGALRRAHKMWDLTSPAAVPEALVAKISKREDESAERYAEDAKMQMVARNWAQAYNARNPPKKVEFLCVYVLKLLERQGQPLCAVEKYLKGEYVRYNNNWDWAEEKRSTPQAFSHFSYEASRQKLLICDLQGVGDLYTDPQIHTADGIGFGRGNKAKEGFEKFFSAHRCNDICRYLGLPSRGQDPKPVNKGTPATNRYPTMESLESSAHTSSHGSVGTGMLQSFSHSEAMRLPPFSLDDTESVSSQHLSSLREGAGTSFGVLDEEAGADRGSPARSTASGQYNVKSLLTQFDAVAPPPVPLPESLSPSSHHKNNNNNNARNYHHHTGKNNHDFIGTSSPSSQQQLSAVYNNSSSSSLSHPFTEGRPLSYDDLKSSGQSFRERMTANQHEKDKANSHEGFAMRRHDHVGNNESSEEINSDGGKQQVASDSKNDDFVGVDAAGRLLSHSPTASSSVLSRRGVAEANSVIGHPAENFSVGTGYSEGTPSSPAGGSGRYRFGNIHSHHSSGGEAAGGSGSYRNLFQNPSSPSFSPTAGGNRSPLSPLAGSVGGSNSGVINNNNNNLSPHSFALLAAVASSGSHRGSDTTTNILARRALEASGGRIVGRSVASSSVAGGDGASSPSLASLANPLAAFPPSATENNKSVVSALSNHVGAEEGKRVESSGSTTVDESLQKNLFASPISPPVGVPMMMEPLQLTTSSVMESQGQETSENREGIGADDDECDGEEETLTATSAVGGELVNSIENHREQVSPSLSAAELVQTLNEKMSEKSDEQPSEAERRSDVGEGSGDAQSSLQTAEKILSLEMGNSEVQEKKNDDESALIQHLEASLSAPVATKPLPAPTASFSPISDGTGGNHHHSSAALFGVVAHNNSNSGSSPRLTAPPRTPVFGSAASPPQSSSAGTPAVTSSNSMNHQSSPTSPAIAAAERWAEAEDARVSLLEQRMERIRGDLHACVVAIEDAQKAVSGGEDVSLSSAALAATVAEQEVLIAVQRSVQSALDEARRRQQRARTLVASERLAESSRGFESTSSPHGNNSASFSIVGSTMGGNLGSNQQNPSYHHSSSNYISTVSSSNLSSVSSTSHPTLSGSPMMMPAWGSPATGAHQQQQVSSSSATGGGALPPSTTSSLHFHSTTATATGAAQSRYATDPSQRAASIRNDSSTSAPSPSSPVVVVGGAAVDGGSSRPSPSGMPTESASSSSSHRSMSNDDQQKKSPSMNPISSVRPYATLKDLATSHLSAAESLFPADIHQSSTGRSYSPRSDRSSATGISIGPGSSVGTASVGGPSAGSGLRQHQQKQTFSNTRTGGFSTSSSATAGMPQIRHPSPDTHHHRPSYSSRSPARNRHDLHQQSHQQQQQQQQQQIHLKQQAIDNASLSARSRLANPPPPAGMQSSVPSSNNNHRSKPQQQQPQQQTAAGSYNPADPSSFSFSSMDSSAAPRDQAGVGMRIECGPNQTLVVTGVLPSGGAARAGIRSGDVLVAVDGVPLRGCASSAVKDLIVGPVGSSVLLQVKSGDKGEIRSVNIVRTPVSSSDLGGRQHNSTRDLGISRALVGSPLESARVDLPFSAYLQSPPSSRSTSPLVVNRQTAYSIWQQQQQKQQTQQGFPINRTRSASPMSRGTHQSSLQPPRAGPANSGAAGGRANRNLSPPPAARSGSPQTQHQLLQNRAAAATNNNNGSNNNTNNRMILGGGAGAVSPPILRQATGGGNLSQQQSPSSMAGSQRPAGRLGVGQRSGMEASRSVSPSSSSAGRGNWSGNLFGPVVPSQYVPKTATVESSKAPAAQRRPAPIGSSSPALPMASKLNVASPSPSSSATAQC